MLGGGGVPGASVVTAGAVCGGGGGGAAASEAALATPAGAMPGGGGLVVLSTLAVTVVSTLPDADPPPDGVQNRLRGRDLSLGDHGLGLSYRHKECRRIGGLSEVIGRSFEG